MTRVGAFLCKIAEVIAGLCLSVLLGYVGGGLCGAAILSLNVFLGRSGTTGEHFGDWSTAVAYLGFMYGGIFGPLVTPFAYVFFVRKIGFQKALWPAFAGTLFGGFVGAFAATPVAVLFGIIGFFAAIGWATSKHSARSV